MRNISPTHRKKTRNIICCEGAAVLLWFNPQLRRKGVIMVKVELSEDQIESIIGIMDSELYWNTDTPRDTDQYYVEIYERLYKALKKPNPKKPDKLSRFENIVR